MPPARGDGEFSPATATPSRAILGAAGIRADCEREDEDMTSIMRRTVRGAAAGLGALAIVAGTAACGGLLGGDAEEDSPSVEEQDPAQDEGDDGADEEADPGEDTEAGDDAETGDDADNDDAGGAETLGEEDLTKAGDRFYAFFEAIGNEDPEAACLQPRHRL